MADKSTRWAFTAYEQHYKQLDAIVREIEELEKPSGLVAEIGWQDEICPETARPHRQGFIRTVRQVRHHQARSIIPSMHIDIAKNWKALLNYCSKEKTRDGSGNPVHVSTTWRPLRLHEILKEVGAKVINQLYLEAGPGETPSRIDRQTDRRHLLNLLREHSKELVRDNPEYAVVLCRQDAKDTWCEYIELWMEQAEG